MNSIEQQRADVDAKHPADNANANKTIAGQHVAESIVQSNGASKTKLLRHPRFNPAQELKETTSFRRLLESDGHKIRKSGGSVNCCCPFHRDNNPSFFIFNDVSAYCFGCGWKGDIFKYEMNFHHVDFKVALKRLQGKCTRVRRAVPFVTPQPKENPEEGLNPSQQEIIGHAIDRLKNDVELCQRIADARGWKGETILRLAVDGSLGWYRGALGFIYATGLKLRDWPIRQWAFEFGHGCLWRQEALNGAERVFLMESETDAISLIDCGFEKKPGVVVVASPSATIFDAAWAPRFDGKIVTIAYDNDRAGEDGLQKVVSLLYPYAAQLFTVDLTEVK